MKSYATKQKIDIPDGEYNALWSAYKLKILSSEDEEIAIAETYMGVKGINCPVNVKIKHGNVTFINK